MTKLHLTACCLAACSTLVFAGCGGSSDSGEDLAKVLHGDAAIDEPQDSYDDEREPSSDRATRRVTEKELLGLLSEEKPKTSQKKPLEKKIDDYYDRERQKPKKRGKLIQYADGTIVFDGMWAEWHPNGTKQYEGTYDNGEQIGLWTYWYDNEKEAKVGRFEQGKPDGKWTYWRKDGTVEHIENYNKGVKNGLWVYNYEKERRQREMTFKDGVLDGEQRVWHGNDQLATQVFVSNGQREGIQKTWYPSGQLKQEIGFHENKQHGMHRQWNEEGELTSEHEWENGKLVTKSSADPPKADESSATP